MSQEDKEQQARIALLDYFGSLARHWATVVLTTAVVFYAIVQVRDDINNDWLFSFALTFTVAEGGYAFLRMITHGKYCELALDNEVIPMGPGTYVTKMLNGMHHNLIMHFGRGLRFCDKLGDHRGFVFYALIGVIANIVFAPLGRPCVWTLVCRS